MTRTPSSTASDDLAVIGWMEMIDLPDLGLNGIKTKIDTGARTSALHAYDIDMFGQNGAAWVRFTTTALGDPATLTAPVVDNREIKNTSGVPENRPVIRTKARFGTRSWTIDLSLTDRSNMTFGLIIGRSALKNHRIAVHTRRAFLFTQRPAGADNDPEEMP